MCCCELKPGDFPEIFKARQKDLAKRHLVLLDKVLKAFPKAPPKR